MHLSSPDRPWGKPFTNKLYLHPPFAENIVTLWPTSMVLIGEIPPGNSRYWYKDEKYGNRWTVTQPSAGVIFTLKRENDLLFRKHKEGIRQSSLWDGEFMPIKITKYHVRKDGVPIHGLTKDLDAIKFHQEAFCDDQRVSTAYIKVTVENGFGIPQTVSLEGLARVGHETLFTGCYEPDGYAGYSPNREMWDSLEPMTPAGNCLTNGRYKLYLPERESFEFSGENDFHITLHLKPYEKKVFTFALSRNDAVPQSYHAARKKAETFWRKELGKAKFIPNKKNIEPLFYHFLAQLLQMFACPQGETYTIMRQGCTQRFHWPEAKEIIKALAHAGGYSDYIEAGLSHYFNDMQETSGDNIGRIHDACVPWNSRTSAALEMFACAVASDDSFYERYVDQAMAGFRWMERERAKSAKIAGAIPGLFPPGIATDNHFPDAQQWTFADTSMLRGYEYFLKTLKAKNSPYLPEVQAAYDDYFGIMKSIFDGFAEAQKDNEFLYLPRDPKNNPELEAGLNKDPFLYMFPNEALALGLAGYGTPEAEKLIYTYSYGGQSRNGLLYPTYHSTTGAGRTWYTTWAEHSRFTYYKRSQNWEQCKTLVEALLKYNVTAEYCQCERYDDHDAYTAPWMPNASANGRVLDMLFDCYGKKEISSSK